MTKVELDDVTKFLTKENLNFYLTTHIKKTTTGTRYYQDRLLLNKGLKMCENDDNDYHKNIDYVYHISTLINSSYSTRMGADKIYATVKRIIALPEKEMFNFISRRKAPIKTITDLLEEKSILEINETKKEFRSYSFLTKYIAIHSHFLDAGEAGFLEDKGCSHFPIYDRQVQEVLKTYGLNKKKILIDSNIIKEEEWINVKSRTTVNTTNYAEFYFLMNKIRGYLDTNFTNLDKFFWCAGNDLKNEK